MNAAAEHAEWLSLLEYSGPFLTMPVLLQQFPDGLDAPPSRTWAALRRAVELRDAGELAKRDFVFRVLAEILDYDDDVLKSGPICEGLRHPLPEWGEFLQPDAALLPPPKVSFDLDEPEDHAAGEASEDAPARPLLLVMVFPDAPLDRALAGSRCPWSPARRMEELCRASGAPLGLVSDGERFMLVHARQNHETTYVSWYASYWLEERVTLRSFVTLLHKRRFFSVEEEETLPRLMERSASAQWEVTEKLGAQVRGAIVEFLGALDRLDRNADRKLLGHIPADRLYEAALAVMMRLVFLLSAEERGMLRLGDPAYDGAYAVSTLCESLRELADRDGEEALSYRTDAWCRLLALFRAVYGGVTHEDLRLIAYGGSLFNPDAHPFLEGRPEGGDWRVTPARPLPVDDRVVLHMLESLQFLRDRRATGMEGAVRLSFRGLDVEQIGHVYEGLLDRTARRADEILLGLSGGPKMREPFIPLAQAEAWLAEGETALAEKLAALTGAAARSLQAALRPAAPGAARTGRRGRPGRNADAEAEQAALAEAARFRRDLLAACGGDEALAERLAPFGPLLRVDVFGRPLVVLRGGLYVTPGSRRRDTGTHYTPRSLTTLLVRATLEPHVFLGPEQGLPRDQWRRRPAAELLSLKVCDMAMGSGAFLVQSCRWLAEQVAEAWTAERTPDVPVDPEERLAEARRRIADTCLYGVDNNPLAVEMAKLSLWLITLRKDRPFTFLDHALRCGDALMGVTSLDQLEEFNLAPEASNAWALRTTDMSTIIQRVRDNRKALENLRSDTPLNVDRKAALLAEAEKDVARLRPRADALIMAYARGAGSLTDADRYWWIDRVLSTRFAEHPEELAAWLEEKRIELIQGKTDAEDGDDEEAVPATPGYTRPLHWALEFPEVFGRDNPGFDALVGNPPFKGSQIMRADLGTNYREYLVRVLGNDVRGKSDLTAYFFLRAAALLRRGGDFGLIATNTIAQGDTREVGLLQLERQGFVIRAAWPDMPWEGNATVCTSQLVLRRPMDAAGWAGGVSLNDQTTSTVSSFLKDGAEEWEAKPLEANRGISFQGSIVLGKGFLVSEAQARAWQEARPETAAVLFPYLSGSDFTSSPRQEASRWVINFFDWTEEQARHYAEPYQHILDTVKPIRQRLHEDGRYVLRKPLPQKWWIFADKRPALYHALGRGDAFAKHPKGWKPVPPLERVLVIARVSKYGAVAFVPNTMIMSEEVCVFASADAAQFGLLQSNLHHVWARKMSSTFGLGLRYTPSSAFDTFPLPAGFGEAGALQALRESAEDLHGLRAAVMRDQDIGLTTLYNHIHDPESDLPGVADLRDRHEDLDRQAALAYGWDDLDMRHDFRQVDYLPADDNTRHTIAEATRLETLRRLSALNKERWEAEQAAAPAKKTRRARKNDNPRQGSLL